MEHKYELLLMQKRFDELYKMTGLVEFSHRGLQVTKDYFKETFEIEPVETVPLAYSNLVEKAIEFYGVRIFYLEEIK